MLPSDVMLMSKMGWWFFVLVLFCLFFALFGFGLVLGFGFFVVFFVDRWVFPMHVESVPQLSGSAI